MIREGCRHKEGPRHDCDQVDEREAIAEHAARVATMRVPKPEGEFDQTEWSAAWDRAYWEEVTYQDALAAAAKRGS